MPADVSPASPEHWERFERAALSNRVEVETMRLPGTTTAVLFVQAFAADAPELRKSA